MSCSKITEMGLGSTSFQIGSLENGQVLKYNSTSGKWENAAGGGMAQHGNEYHDPDMALASDLTTHIGQESAHHTKFTQTEHDALPNPHHSNANDPSSDQKAALAGTDGTPSGTNEYVTNSDPRNSDARTPLAHNQAATTINSGTLDGDRLPAMSATKKGGVPATGTPSGKFLKDDATWDTPTGGSGLTHPQVMARVFIGA